MNSLHFSNRRRVRVSLLVDFREMQRIAQTEYAELKQQYDLLVTPDRDGSNFLPNNNKL
jgi:hypothetical protein